MNRTKRVVLHAALLFLGLLTAGTIPFDAASRDPSSDDERVTIVTARGPVVFYVELADTPASRMRGLQGRQSLAADSGMLFVFGVPQNVRMWMKDTLIPLDMLFIDAQGRIAKIAAQTTPLSLTPIGADAPVTAVLEVPGGSAERLGIKAGDRVEHPAFGSLQLRPSADR